MATELADYIAELDQARPAGSESLGEADDHLKLLKRCIANTFLGGEDDGYNTALTVGPRYLNSLATDFKPNTYVKTTGDQDVAGLKTFTDHVKFDNPILGADGYGILGIAPHEGVDYSFVSNYERDTIVVSKGPDLVHFFGDELDPDGGYILSTANIVEQVLDKILHVGFIIQTDNDTFNPNSEAFYPGTWEQTSKGRVLVGSGVPTPDEDGYIPPDFGSYEPGTEFGRWFPKLQGVHVPPHIHEMPFVMEGYALGGANRARFITRQTAGPDYTGDAPEGVPVYQPSQVTHIWTRVS